jgi:hypothetical protein
MAQLEADGGFKASVLTELKTIGRYVPIAPLVREYVEGVAAVHDRLRALSDPYVTAWEALLGTVEDRARITFPDHQVGLPVVVETEEGIWSQIDYVFRDPWKRQRNCTGRSPS